MEPAGQGHCSGSCGGGSQSTGTLFVTLAGVSPGRRGVLTDQEVSHLGVLTSGSVTPNIAQPPQGTHTLGLFEQSGENKCLLDIDLLSGQDHTGLGGHC
jgi:hypothetical protein